MTKLRNHLRNNVVAYLAVFLSLGLGTAWASQELGKGSVDSKAIENGKVKTQDIGKAAVTTRKLARGAVTSRKVQDGSLRGRDFRAGELPAGAEGPPGQSGATNVSMRFGPQEECQTEGCEQFSIAHCDPGEVATGGGGSASPNDDLIISVPHGANEGEAPTGWVAYVSEEAGDGDSVADVIAYVVCAAP